MRAWEGYSKRNLDYFLGPKGQRSLMLKELTQKFQAAYGPSWNFTDEQIKILQNIDSSFTVLDCIAGAGKTTMLVALALWMLHNKRLGFGGCLHYMTETQEMVNEFIDRVRHVHKSCEGITAIGYDRVTGDDRLASYLRERLDEQQFPLDIAVSEIENALDFLWLEGPTIYDEQDWEDWERVQEIFKCVLTVHHVILHCSYYKSRQEQQQVLLQNLTVIACTTATANRLNGGSNPWSKMFGKLNKTLCVADEIQGLSRLECAGFSCNALPCNTADMYDSIRHRIK